MNADTLLRCVCSAVLLLMSLDASAHRDPIAHCGLSGVRYEAIDLGPIGQDTGFSALNDRGEMIGTISLSDVLGRAVVWDCRNGAQIIGAVDENDYVSMPMDINNRGEVVGFSADQDNFKAFIWNRDDGIRAIGSQTGGLAYTINDWGDVLMRDNTIWNARTGSRPTEDVLGFSFSDLAFTNDRRHIGGVRLAEDGVLKFFDWSARGGVHDLAIVPDASYTEVAAMNDRGDLVGDSRNALHLGRTVPYLVTRNGDVQFLLDPRGSIPGSVDSINNRRQVVGYLEGESGAATYLWDPENGMRVLSELLVPRLRGFRAGGSAINNWGWIAGGIYDPAKKEGRAALLVPIREGTRRFDHISRLQGEPLCRALNQLKLDALVTCLLTRQ